MNTHQIKISEGKKKNLDFCKFCSKHSAHTPVKLNEGKMGTRCNYCGRVQYK